MPYQKKTYDRIYGYGKSYGRCYGKKQQCVSERGYDYVRCMPCCDRYCLCHENKSLGCGTFCQYDSSLEKKYITAKYVAPVKRSQHNYGRSYQYDTYGKKYCYGDPDKKYWYDDEAKKYYNDARQYYYFNSKSEK